MAGRGPAPRRPPPRRPRSSRRAGGGVRDERREHAVDVVLAGLDIDYDAGSRSVSLVIGPIETTRVFGESSPIAPSRLRTVEDDVNVT